MVVRLRLLLLLCSLFCLMQCSFGRCHQSASVRRLQQTVLECTPPALVCNRVGAICLVIAAAAATANVKYALPFSAPPAAETELRRPCALYHCLTRIYNYWKSDYELCYGRIRILAFPPENPDSLSGSRLLRPLTPQEGLYFRLAVCGWIVTQINRWCGGTEKLPHRV